MITESSGPTRRRSIITLKNTKRRLSPEEQARFAKVSADFVIACARKKAAGFLATVTKKQIIYVLGPGYSGPQVDRKRASDPLFPKPIDENAHILQWRFDDLIAYRQATLGAA